MKRKLFCLNMLSNLSSEVYEQNYSEANLECCLYFLFLFIRNLDENTMVMLSDKVIKKFGMKSSPGQQQGVTKI